MQVTVQQRGRLPAQLQPVAREPWALRVGEAERGELEIGGEMPAKAGNSEVRPPEAIDFRRRELPPRCRIEPDHHTADRQSREQGQKKAGHEQKFESAQHQKASPRPT